MNREEIKLQIIEYMKMYVPDGEAIGAEKILRLIEKSQTPSPTGDRDCEELKKEVERLKGLIGIDWKEEYDQAVNEIGQLQDQLKEAENEIRELNRNL